MRRRADLLLVSVLAAIGALVSLHGSGAPALRVVFAALLLLVLPGYSVTVALIGRRRADPAELLLLSLGLSLSLVIVVSLFLDLSPWGLRRESWLVALLVVVLACSGIAAWRRRGERAGVSRNQSRLPRLTAAQGLAVLCVPLFLVPAIVIGRRPLPARGISGYTALWLVPAQAAAGPTVRLGLKSGELRPTTYRLQLRIGERIHLWRGLALEPSERWERTIRLPRTRILQSRASKVPPIVAILVRSDRPNELYRQVKLWTIPSTARASE